MRALRAAAPGELVLDEVPRPDPGPDDVVVRVRACGICGTDLHWYHGAFPAPPVCPGHEIAGEVAAVGSAVRALREGDAVALEGVIGCGECAACRSGSYHLCGALGIVGLTVPGGFADYVRIPARHCFRTSAGLAPAIAALSEPLAVAVHGVRLAPVSIGARVLVLGAGTIGLMAVLAARAGGAGEILVTARRPQQREAARQLGADRVFGDTDRDALAAAARETPVDVVIETVGGTADTLDVAIGACRAGGTICVLGVFTGTQPIAPTALVAKELTLRGSMVYNRRDGRADFEITQDLLAREHARLERVVTHRVPLAEAARGFALAADKASGSIKVTVTGDGVA
ncbi:MAG TPA: alcohol dehydrogenase catalytic domain-containing protein [Candidatus Limnocylindria bacterium]|nr:alcohol dehydrogenase catalytic domain-containing protein [Candidatus Limnocylindria bacterium]